MHQIEAHAHKLSRIDSVTRGATTSLSWGSIPWSRVLLPFYRNKLDRSTKFGAVGYIITIYSSKSYVKRWGPSNPQSPSDCAHEYDGDDNLCIRFVRSFVRFFIVRVLNQNNKLDFVVVDPATESEVEAAEEDARNQNKNRNKDKTNENITDINSQQLVEMLCYEKNIRI